MIRTETLPAPTFLLLVAFCSGCVREAPRPNVLLITVDTLRADRISAAGYARQTTPNLDGLAAQGLLFTHAETPRAKTMPAIASLLTGLYPHDHGARDLLVPLERDVPLLPDRLREAGYATGAVVGNYVLLDRFSGLARGFDVWREDLPDRQGVPPDDVPQRTARSLTDEALALIGLRRGGAKAEAPPLAREGKPWFLWLHYMDPHGLYDPPAEHRVFRSESNDWIPDEPGPGGDEIQRFTVARYNVPPACRAPDGRGDAAAVRDLYDGEVHYADAEIGRLLDELRTAGLLDRTFVVVTADHGESLGEHRYWFEHGRDVYETTCRVPLIVRFPAPWPGRPAAGVRQGDLSLADLAPTLLDTLHLPPLPKGASGISGASRRNLFEPSEPMLRAVFTEKVDRAPPAGVVQMKAVRIGDWKLIRRYAHAGDSAPPSADRVVVLSEELYDLARDPGEEKNLSASPPPNAPVARLQEELAAFSAADASSPHRSQRLEGRPSAPERDDQETLRILQALGY